MATVYLAHDPRFGRDVALKAIGVGYNDDPTFRNRFEREARTIATLEHPAIVPVYDFGEDNDQLYLVMRYMTNGTLTDRIVMGPMAGERAISIIRRIADALDHAHKNGVIHRDLKPGNILFDQYERAYLSDFGIVKLAAEGTDTDLTGSGVIGTPAYMSPEQIHGDVVIDGRSDIYTLGVILFEMLTGRKPYRAETPVKQMMAHVMDPIPDISQFLPDFPSDCVTVIQKALAKEPNDRYQTAQDLTADLSATLTGNRYSPIPRPYSPTLGEKETEAESEETDTVTNLTLPKETEAETAVKDPVTIVNPNIASKLEKPIIPSEEGPTVTDAPIVDKIPLKREPVGANHRGLQIAAIGLIAVVIFILFMVLSARNNNGTSPLPTAQPENIIVDGTVPVDEPSNEPAETAVVTQPILAEPTEVPAPGIIYPEKFSIGQSNNGQEIVVDRFGDGEQKILLVGGLHADFAPSTVNLMENLKAAIDSEEISVPEDISLFILSKLNPDSVGTTNSNSVDLNRNWGCNWQPNPTYQGIVVDGLGGPLPFSEPESVALRDFIIDLKPTVVLIWQAGIATGWVSPGRCGSLSRYGSEWAMQFGNASGYFTGDIDSLPGQSVSGDVAGWLDSQGVAAVTIWLPSRETVDFDPNAAGLNAVLAQVVGE